MGDKYEVSYWDYENKQYVTGLYYFHHFLKAYKFARKLLKDWYAVSITMRR